MNQTILSLAKLTIAFDMVKLEAGEEIISPAIADLSLSPLSSYLLNLTTDEECEISISNQFSESQYSDFYDEVEEHELGNFVSLPCGTPVELPLALRPGTTQLVAHVVSAPNSSLALGTKPNKELTRFHRLKISEDIGLSDVGVDAWLIQTPLRNSNY